MDESTDDNFEASITNISDIINDKNGVYSEYSDETKETFQGSKKKTLKGIRRPLQNNKNISPPVLSDVLEPDKNYQDTGLNGEDSGDMAISSLSGVDSNLGSAANTDDMARSPSPEQPKPEQKKFRASSSLGGKITKGLRARKPSIAKKSSTQSTKTVDEFSIDFLGKDTDHELNYANTRSSQPRGSRTTYHTDSKGIQVPLSVSPGPQFYFPLRHWQKASDKYQMLRKRKEHFSFMDTKLRLLNRKKLFGAVIANLKFKEAGELRSKMNQEMAQNASKLIDGVTTSPLTNVWHHFVQVAALLVFFFSLVVEVYDIATAPEYLYYKITSLLLGVAENIVILVMIILYKSKVKNLRDKDKEKMEKHQQYVENITHEVLLYPLLTISAYGIANDKIYKIPNENNELPMYYITVVLVAIEMIEVIWTQCVRMRMVYKLFSDIQGIMDTQNVNVGLCGWSLSGSILQRTYLAVIGNILIFLYLFLMMTFQIHYDNLTTEDYTITVSSGVVMLTFTLLPVLGLVLFVFINAYWALEILITINMTIAKNAELTEKLSEDYGDMLTDAIGYAQDNLETSQKRLRNIKNVSTIKKAFYGVTDPIVIILLIIWEALFCATIYLFEGFENDTYNILTKFGLCLIMVVTNFHILGLMIVADIVVIVAIIAIAFYPISIFICWRTRGKSAEAVEAVTVVVEEKVEVEEVEE